MVQKMIGVRNVHWCLLVMMISKMIKRIHWNLTGSLMPQLIIFLLFSYVLSFRPAPLTFPYFSSLLIRPCLFVSFLSTSIPVISISALSCHPPPSLLFVKMKLNVFFIPRFLASLLTLPRFSFNWLPPSLKLFLRFVSSLTGASEAAQECGSSQKEAPYQG